MENRALGQQGLEVSELGLGTMGMTMAYGAGDVEGGIETIRRAHELGVNFIDTAELYGLGTGSNEQLVGRAVKGFRDEIVIATKFGFDLSDPAKIGTTFDSRPAHIREVVENSLRYLDTDRIDVLYQHRVDPDTPIEEVAGAVRGLIEAGKVRFFGLSEAGPDIVRRAHAVQPVSVVQTEYSIFEREVDEAVLPVLRELGIGFVAYSPLGRGFLTNDFKPAAEYEESDMRSWDDRWQGENYRANARAVEQLRALAAAKEISVAQLALAWLLAQGPDVVPIPGTRNQVRLAENVASAEITLTREDLDHVQEILPHGSYGARYPASMLPQWA
jgi:aryl-alcohol dehydrogenase-like predicted oxidoreductase